MKAQYLKHLKKWTAFMTINGLDVQEFGTTEKQAKQKLAERIFKSDFLINGIKMNP